MSIGQSGGSVLGSSVAGGTVVVTSKLADTGTPAIAVLVGIGVVGLALVVTTLTRAKANNKQ